MPLETSLGVALGASLHCSSLSCRPTAPGHHHTPKNPRWEAFASIANYPGSQTVPQTCSCSPGSFFMCLMDMWSTAGEQP